MKCAFIIIDDRVMPPNPRILRDYSPGYLLGNGLFETLRLRKGYPVDFKAHLTRMKKGISVLNLSPPFSFKKVERSVLEAIEKSGIDNGRLRFSIWKRYGKIHTSTVIQRQGVRLKSDSSKAYRACWAHLIINEASPTIGIKSFDYRLFLRARRYAERRGYEEALLCNRKNCIVEGSHSNIFWIKRGCLHTPDLKTGCLPGITRARVMRIAKQLGLKIRRTQSRRKELFDCQEVFLTNSLFGIMPLVSLERIKIADGRPGQLTKQLRVKLEKEIG